MNTFKTTPQAMPLSEAQGVINDMLVNSPTPAQLDLAKRNLAAIRSQKATTPEAIVAIDVEVPADDNDVIKQLIQRIDALEAQLTAAANLTEPQDAPHTDIVDALSAVTTRFEALREKLDAGDIVTKQAIDQLYGPDWDLASTIKEATALQAKMQALSSLIVDVLPDLEALGGDTDGSTEVHKQAIPDVDPDDDLFPGDLPIGIGTNVSKMIVAAMERRPVTKDDGEDPSKVAKLRKLQRSADRG